MIEAHVAHRTMTGQAAKPGRRLPSALAAILAGFVAGFVALALTEFSALTIYDE